MANVQCVRYNLAACASAYSPTAPEMGSYSARTVVTYQTHIETGMRGHGPLSWGGGVPGVASVPHKWSDDREDMDPRMKGKGVVGNDGNMYIPDSTLAQLTVKELNKRVSQVSSTFIII